MSTAVAPNVEAPGAPCSIYLGLDVHKESIVLSVLPAGAPAPTARDKLPHDLRKLKRYCERLMRDGASVYACYEASGAGYVLQRAMQQWGVHCDLIAPSLIPKQPGRKRRNDRYDADQLARLYRSGDLTVIRVPSAAEERVRDLVRCRTTLQRQLQRARQFVLRFCTRRGLRYTAGRSIGRRRTGAGSGPSCGARPWRSKISWSCRSTSRSSPTRSSGAMRSTSRSSATR